MNASGALPNLEKLWLQGNTIGDAGITTFADAVSNGVLTLLKVLYVDDGPLGTEHPALKVACEAREIFRSI